MSIPLHASVDNIADILKLSDARIASGDCWMIYDEHQKTFVIFQRKHRKRNSNIVFESADEELAAKEFIKLTAE